MRVVVSLTTLPGRYRKLARTLYSIYNQTVKLDAIYLGIPRKAKRLNIDYPELPSEITDKCTIISLDQDYGPICKILGGLLSEKDPETIIITIDDDIVYPKNLIEELVKYSTAYPNSAIGSTGVLLGKNLLGFASVSASSPTWNGFTGFKVPPEGRPVDILCGVSGILYRRKFFPMEFAQMLNYALEDPNLFMNDDILISLYIGSRGVERRLFMDIPFVSQEKFFDPDIDIKDGNEISFSRTKFLTRFCSAVETSRQLGLLNNPVPSDIDDSLPLRLIFALVIVVVLILAIWLIFTRT